MGDVFAENWKRVSEWFRRAHEERWLSEAELAELGRIERQTPADLFDRSAGRPLVVAFFGGTGVGKSSLLNRLVGDQIARTGIERPTSHEVTAYVHADVALARLPEGMPLDRVKIARHHDDQRRDVMWVDMPDIDSTETRNRKLALAWLPHIDLLVYVVSPERYRDDAGWQVLRERGHKHGWLFIMNRWDEGAEEQIVDLSTNLNKAGFARPVILRTCCASTGCPELDDFPQLEETIHTLQAEHGQRELERRGEGAKLRELAAALETARKRLGTDAQWRTIHEQFTSNWNEARQDIVKGMTWPIHEFAASFKPAKTFSVQRLLGAWQQQDKGVVVANDLSEKANLERSNASLPDGVRNALWDSWADAKLSEVLDELELAMRRTAVAAAPLIGSLRKVVMPARNKVGDCLARHLSLALSRPGTLLQRTLRRLAKTAMRLLPALALGWVGFHVVRGYYRGVTEQAEFLGVNFAINSVLLVLVAWLVPFIVHRLLEPPVEEAVTRALRDGLAEGIDDLGDNTEMAFQSVNATRLGLVADAEGLVNELAARIPPTRPPGPALVRMVPQPEGVSP